MKHRIYIVDDDEDLLKLLAHKLIQSGFDVSTFSNGYPIIEMTDEWPDLFILDIELMDINGLEICKWLKSNEKSRHVPVLFLSASTYLKALAEDARGDDYLEKPFDYNTLLDKINNCLMGEMWA